MFTKIIQSVLMKHVGKYLNEVEENSFDVGLIDGDILIDSVLRFKGRAAPCVILTEIDFEQLDDKAVRRLFVGATRATMKLILVVAESSAAVLRERLADAA